MTGYRRDFIAGGADFGEQIEPAEQRDGFRKGSTHPTGWLPISGMKAADAPSFERYDEKFDPATGNGGLEIWVPVRELYHRTAMLPCTAGLPAVAWQAISTLP
mgnify:CR=1 FL=1